MRHSHAHTALRALLLGSLGFPVQACASSSAADTHSNRLAQPDGSVPADARLADAFGAPLACSSPEPLLAGQDTGFFRCAEGYTHRAEEKACPSRLPRDVEIAIPKIPGNPADAGRDSGLDGGERYITLGKDECSRDSDCSGPNAFCELWTVAGRCSYLPGLTEPPKPSRLCEQGCTVDADCGANAVCVCGTDIGHCVPVSDIAGCHSDADCADGSLCLDNAHAGGFGEDESFGCQLPGDQCHTNQDCGSNQHCAIETAGRRCKADAVCGRPFLVAGMVRAAEPMRRDDWRDELAVTGVALIDDPALRQRVVEHWTRVGLMEHASVAAFARFTLQLLALGAPADLVQASLEAQSDETRHARLAFALASGYGGVPVGPGPLSMTDALGDGSVEAILRTTILEGCVGETRAALEAAEAARLTTDRSLRGILLGVAADEGRHAALAWRVVQWLLAERPGLASVARDMFTSSLEEPEAFDEPMTSEDVAGAHGLLDSAALSSIHSDAARLVIGPCAVALLLSLALHYHGSAWSVVDTPNVGGALIPAVVRTPGRAHRVHDFAQLGRLDLFGA